MEIAIIPDMFNKIQPNKVGEESSAPNNLIELKKLCQEELDESYLWKRWF